MKNTHGNEDQKEPKTGSEATREAVDGSPMGREGSAAGKPEGYSTGEEKK